MDHKPITAAGYPPDLAVEARRMCLYVATILGDLLDHVVVVGGLVPYLIVDQAHVEDGERHVGTRDLDLGLSIAVLQEERYRHIAERLREVGFEQAANEKGRPTRQTWKLREERITIDFLIPPSSHGQAGGSLQHLESDFAAWVAPALTLAFQDRERVEIDDWTPAGERARREVSVAGPAAFVGMKAHAFRMRGANKDAYDLVYVLRNHGQEPVVEVAARFARLADAPEAMQALRFLAEDFATEAHLGPRRYAAFLGDPGDPERAAQAYGAVREFLRLVEDHSPGFLRK